jgi:predicted lysophospholipase L1 biosynthesis ABC-type transport system permease subunit
MARAAGSSRPHGAGHDDEGAAIPGVPLRQAVAVIAVAVIVALAVWALVRLIGVAPVVGRSGDITAVTAGSVVVATVMAGVAAWATHALLRHVGRATQWWPFVGSTALAVSIIGPSWLADGASGLALICMHVAVGIVLIAGFHRVGRGAARRATDGSAVTRGGHRRDPAAGGP